MVQVSVVLPEGSHYISPGYCDEVRLACREVAEAFQQKGILCTEFQVIFYRGPGGVRLPCVAVTYVKEGEDPLTYASGIPFLGSPSKERPNKSDIVSHLSASIA